MAEDATRGRAGHENAGSGNSHARRRSTPAQRTALCMAVDRAVEWLGGGRVARTLTRVGAPLLSAYGSPDVEKRFAPLDVALDLDLEFVRRGQEPPILSAYRALVEGGGGSMPAGAVTLADLRRLHKEAGEAMTGLLEAIDDGGVTERERRALLSEIDDLDAIIALIRRKLIEGRVS